MNKNMVYEEACENLCCMLDNVNRSGQMGSQEVDEYYKITKSLLNLKTVEAMDEYDEDDEYEEDESLRRSGRRPMYTGRRSSRPYNMSSHGNYDMRSRHGESERVIAKLETMMRSSENDRTRQAIQECINDLRQN